MLKSPQNTSEIWQLCQQQCQSFWISLLLLVSSALDSWTPCPINMSLRLHQKPFWSNCQWIKFRSFSTGFQSKMWLPPSYCKTLLLLCCRVRKTEIHYVICVTSRNIFEYNFWVHLKFLRYLLPRCWVFHTFVMWLYLSSHLYWSHGRVKTWKWCALSC